MLYLLFVAVTWPSVTDINIYGLVLQGACFIPLLFSA